MQFAQSPQQKDFPSSIFYLSLLFFKNQKSKIEGKKLKLGFKLISLKIQSQEKPDQPGMIFNQKYLLESCTLGCNPSTFSSCAPSQEFKELSNKAFGSVPQQCTNTNNAIATNTPEICHNHHKYFKKNCLTQNLRTLKCKISWPQIVVVK